MNELTHVLRSISWSKSNSFTFNLLLKIKFINVILTNFEMNDLNLNNTRKKEPEKDGSRPTIFINRQYLPSAFLLGMFLFFLTISDYNHYFPGERSVRPKVIGNVNTFSESKIASCETCSRPRCSTVIDKT